LIVFSGFVADILQCAGFKSMILEEVDAVSGTYKLKLQTSKNVHQTFLLLQNYHEGIKLYIRFRFACNYVIMIKTHKL